MVRVRPDGTGLEIYSRGTRNILEVAVDPLLNAFARDNTNDGGGWDIRLHHFTGLEDHGYPTLFKNFPAEIVQPLADYGGGSGCGALYLSEPGFPDGYGDALYTADWGRDRVFRHKLTPKGATFTADQTEFLTVPRVTDLDADANGHLYVSSWKGATFTFAGEEVGFILRVTPRGNKPAPLPDYARLDKPGLIKELDSPSHRRRLAAQRELIRRGIDDEPTKIAVINLDTDEAKPLATRVAALFTLKQAMGVRSTGLLVSAELIPKIREFALRALVDRAEGLADVPAVTFAAETKSDDPRVRRQAAAGLARLGKSRARRYPRGPPHRPRPDRRPRRLGGPWRRSRPTDALFAVLDDQAAPARAPGEEPPRPPVDPQGIGCRRLRAAASNWAKIPPAASAAGRRPRPARPPRQLLARR